MKRLMFYNLEEMKDYYNERTNTYAFWGDNGEACDIRIMFDLDTNASILCHNLDAIDIKAESITAWDIDACSINADIIAHDIDATKIKADKIILINDGLLSVMGTIDCSYIKHERLSNW